MLKGGKVPRTTAIEFSLLIKMVQQNREIMKSRSVLTIFRSKATIHAILKLGLRIHIFQVQVECANHSIRQKNR